MMSAKVDDGVWGLTLVRFQYRCVIPYREVIMVISAKEIK